MENKIKKLIETAKELRDEAINSIEYSDWPELQEKVAAFDNALREAGE